MAFARTSRFFSQRPWLISLLLLICLSFWLAIGMLNADESQGHLQSQNSSVQSANSSPSNDTHSSEKLAIPLAKVRYQTFSAVLTAKKIDLYGRTAPNRQAQLSAEVAGRVVTLMVQKGDQVKKNQPIAQIDQADLEIQLERAKANLSVRDKEFKASQSLKKKGLQGEVAYSTAQANLVEAKALVKKAQLNLRNTQITAPFDGFVDDLAIELGDFVSIGDPVATVIDLDVLLIEADVSERHIQSLKLNQKAKIRLLDGDKIEGILRYISRLSSPATNTFPIEIEIANPEKKISAGVSAEVELELGISQAIKISPAMLALDESGNLGVKTVEDDTVKFRPIQLVKAEQDGIWLTGLGQSANIITVGQGFVREGDTVIATSVEATSDTETASDINSKRAAEHN
ncbi:efflux RND transporter periplasmic adaptor subunit [Vibrio sp. TH_r3]|uniref:efflux RND transporter periplasmic adaptor subunit n=1 Tax=Vibrio sp. TH_r3 TaxID=3082084 RepID=UPI002952FE3C|nr:efflux RND transporter periplasmic adaptor subunit [Vibrio sp. TH_r3]MDV7105234.1 efflux RND transporter periplasmic adaptor subunit [Vibrio sp. TH_r3]